MRARISTLVSLSVLAALAACALPEPPKSEQVKAESLPNVTVPGAWTASGATSGEITTSGSVANSWLATFADQRLNALVAEAMNHNPDLRVAAARVQVASEYVELADSTLYPQVNLLARGGGQMGGDSSGLQGVGIFADWEIDLWGRVRSARATQKASYESVVADTEYARQSIAALVAKSYFLAVEAGLQQQLAEDMVGSAGQLVTLTE